jgi:hypothetical protein
MLYNRLLSAPMICFIFMCTASLFSQTELSVTELSATDLSAPDTHEWILMHASTASPEDLQLLLNVMYVSWQRQQALVNVQEKALELLNNFWQAWHVIAYTRRNPSHAHKDDIQPPTLAGVFRRFNSLYDRYLITTATYDTMLNIIKDGDYSPHVRSALADVKHNDRTASVQILQTLRESFNSQSKQAYEFIQYAAQQLPFLYATDAVPKKSIFSWNIPSPFMLAAINIFARFDNMFVATSDRCWEALLSSQRIGNVLWHALATMRATFYKTYYDSLYHAMQRRGIQKSPFYLMFNRYGLIPTTQQTITLPLPH